MKKELKALEIKLNAQRVAACPNKDLQCNCFSGDPEMLKKSVNLNRELLI